MGKFFCSSLNLIFLSAFKEKTPNSPSKLGKNFFVSFFLFQEKNPRGIFFEKSPKSPRDKLHTQITWKK